MKLDCKICLTRSSSYKYKFNYLLRKLQKNKSFCSQLIESDSSIFHKKQVKNPQSFLYANADFIKIKNFNSYNFAIFCLKNEKINEYLKLTIKNEKNKQCDKFKEKFKEFCNFKKCSKSLIIQESIQVCSKFYSILNSNKYDYFYSFPNVKGLEIELSQSDCRDFSKKLLDDLLELIRIIKDIIKKDKFINSLNDKIDEFYLTIGRYQSCNVLFIKNHSLTHSDSKMPDVRSNEFLELVNDDKKRITGVFDSLSNMLSYFDLNEFLNFVDCFDKFSNDKDGSQDFYRHCFMKFSISGKTFKENLNGNYTVSKSIKSLRFYFNLISLCVSHYRSYSTEVLYNYVSQTLLKQNPNIISLDTGVNENFGLIKNHEHNECSNFFIDGSTYVYSVSKCFIFRNIYSELEANVLFNCHEYRYVANNISNIILSNIIFSTLTMRAQYLLQSKTSKVRKLNTHICRLFVVHKLQKFYSNIESLYKADSIYSKLSSYTYASIVQDHMFLRYEEKNTDHSSMHLWQEANTSNGKYGFILNLMCSLSSLISIILCSVILLIGSINDVNLFENNAIKIIVGIILIVLILLVLIKYFVNFIRKKE